MLPRIACLAAALAAALAHSPTAHAAEPSPAGPGARPDPRPWLGPAFTADPKALLAAAQALPVARGQDADMLLDEGRFTLDARGAVTFTHRVVLRVLTADAVRRWSRPEADWAPWYQQRPELRARVISADGEVHPLDPTTLSERPARGDGGQEMFSDTRALTAPLPGVAAGALVELVTVTRDARPSFEAGSLGRFELARTLPVRDVRFALEAPAALPLRWAVRAPPGTVREAVKEQVKDGTRRLSLERRDVPALAPAEVAPPPDQPQGATLAFSWAASWGAVAAHYGEVVQRQLAGADLREPLQAALGDGPRPPREELVRRLTAWLHRNVRYTGLELGEAELVPATPAETLRRRYGDCKDLSLLLLGLVRAAGLDGRLVLVQSGWEELAPELPGIHAFDHVVVRVDGGPAIWVDTTNPYVAPGQLPPTVQGRLALPVGPGVKELVRTPALGSAENLVRVVRELHVPFEGPGRIVETRHLVGAPAATDRTVRDHIPPDRRDEVMGQDAKETFRASQVADLSVQNLDDPSLPLDTRVEVTDSELVLSDGDAAVLPVTADGMLDGLPAPVAVPSDAEGRGDTSPAPARRADLFLPVPYRWELVYRIFPPDGFRPRSLPAGTDERFGPARFTSAWTQEPDGSVTVTFAFDTGARRIPAADADALARRARELRRSPMPAVRLERTSAALLAAGKVREGLAELEAVAKRNPTEPGRRVQLALALHRLGFPGAAAAEARAALAIDADSAWAHRVLAFVLEHDGLGRFHGKGFDRAGAIAEYRKAKDLDAEHAGGRAALAELLAHDADGVLQPAAGGLDEALAELEAVARDLKETRFEPQRLALLLEAGRFEAAEKLARTLRLPTGEDGGDDGPSDPRRVRLLRDAAVVASAAALRGVPAAETEADGLGKGEARRDALREASRVLMQVRRYAEAQALAALAARGSPDAADQARRAQLLEGARPWNTLPEAGDEADRLVRRLVSLAAQPDPAPALAPLFARGRVPADLAKLAELSLAAPAAGVRRAARRQGAPVDVMLDLVLSRLELLRDGDPATGLRLRLHSPLWDGGVAAVFVARDGKALRVLCTDMAWPMLAAEVDRFAAAGDLATARRWLEWMREVLPGDPGAQATPAGILAALWPPGAEGGAPELRRAAAALLAFVDGPGRSAAGLSEARAAATDPAQRRALGLALAQAHLRAGRLEEARQLTAALLADEPASRTAFGLHATVLAKLKDAAGLDAAAKAILARLPGDPEVLQALGDARLSMGDLDGAARTYRQAIDAGRASRGLYNNAAWLEAFRPAPAPQMLDWARRAAQGEPDPVSLNTLAVVHGVLGQGEEAQSVLKQSLEAAGEEPPGPGDWLVQGLAAEAWGLRDVAADAYRKVAQETRDDPTSPWVLAQRRLAALGVAPAPAVAPEVKPAGDTAEPAKPQQAAPPAKRKPGKKAPRKPAAGSATGAPV